MLELLPSPQLSSGRVVQRNLSFRITSSPKMSESEQARAPFFSTRTWNGEKLPFRMTSSSMLELFSSPPFSPGSRVERSWIFRMTSSPKLSKLELLSSPPGSGMERSWIFGMTSSPMLELPSSPPLSPGRAVQRNWSFSLQDYRTSSPKLSKLELLSSPPAHGMEKSCPSG